jgi:ribosomal-protein-alanine N-acetyltransferase
MSAAQVQVRPAVAADLTAIVALERATASAPHWPQATYEAIVSEQNAAGPRCLFVAEMGDALVGFAVGLMHPAAAGHRGERTAELESVVVAASARRAGIGRALCCAVLDWCRSSGATEVALEVRAASTGAVALYTGLGFTQTGRRPRYYREPDDDALTMCLRLDEPGPGVA